MCERYEWQCHNHSKSITSSLYGIRRWLLLLRWYWSYDHTEWLTDRHQLSVVQWRYRLWQCHQRHWQHVEFWYCIGSGQLQCSSEQSCNRLQPQHEWRSLYHYLAITRSTDSNRRWYLLPRWYRCKRWSEWFSDRRYVSVVQWRYSSRRSLCRHRYLC